MTNGIAQDRTSRRTLVQGLPRQVLATDLIALGLLLLAMVAANREWLFNPFRWVDTWMYVGFFQHWDLPWFELDNKKIARLPWILLGFFVNHATSPQTGIFILHLGMFSAGAAALYILLQRQFGRAAAVITTAFYVTYVPGHDAGSGGWDFNNTPAALLYLLTFASLLNMVEDIERPLRNGLIAGLTTAILVHTHILFLLLAPALVIWLIRRVREKLSGQALRHWTKQTLFSGLISGVAVTLVLGTINVIVGREFFFFWKLAGRMSLLIAEPDREKAWWRPWSHPWWYDSHEWPIDGYHTPLIFAVLILIALASVCYRGRRRSLGKVHKESFGIFLVSLIVFVLLQTSGHPLLQPTYMAYPLLIPTMFCVAALLDITLVPATPENGQRWNDVASLTTCASFAAIFILLSALPAPTRQILPYDGLLGILPITLSFVIAGLMLHLPSRPARWLTGAATGLLVVALAGTNGEWPSDPTRREAYSYREACRLRQPTFEMIISADRFLYPLVRAGNYVPLAYRSGETIKINGCDLPLTEVARPLASMGYDVVMPYWKMEATPELPDDVVEKTARERTMISVITRDAAYRERLLQRLRARVPDWHLQSQSPIGDRATGATISVLSRPAPAQGAGG
jgi:hypothetical protein